MTYSKITINKNRGWRGLAEVQVYNPETKNEMKMIFSFSQDVWDDLLNGYIVMQDKDNYYVIEFDNLDSLPRPTQQRSVLIKNFNANITAIRQYDKATWTSAPETDWACIHFFKKNRNNHTTSDWNCIGIRVIPEI